MTQLDESDPGHGSTALLRLLRDGAAAGLTCVVTADRAVPGGRLAAVARQRVVLPLGDTADYAVAGIRPAAVPAHRPPGRALVGEEALECQLALPRPLPQPTRPAADPPIRDGRLRIVALPPDPEVPLPGPPDGAVTGGVGTQELDLVLGPGGDDGGLLRLDLHRTGGLLVVGPPGSGRTSTLAALGAHLVATGAAVLRLGHSTAARQGATPRDGAWLDPADTTGLSAWLAERRGVPAVLIADDVGAVHDWAALTEAVTGRDTSAPAVLAAGAAGDLAGHYQGPVAALRRRRTGLLLCPGPGDADVLGIRLPRAPAPSRPGSGWLVISGTPTRVQVARRRTEFAAKRGPVAASPNR